MNKLLFPILALLTTIYANAQMPLPCYHFDNSNTQRMQTLSGPFYTNCFDVQYPNSAQNVTDDHFRMMYTDEGHMHTEFHINPANDGEFHVVLNDPNVRGDLDAAWYEPANTYEVKKYEKVEWGIELPSVVLERINHWIYNDTHPSLPPQTPTINPFNPEELDVWATVEYTGGHQRVNGFYYAPFRRHSDREDPDMTDPDLWYWEQLPTEHSIRVRFAPMVVGEHKVIIHCNAPGIGAWEMPPFYFYAAENSNSKSFVKASTNGHYFITADNEVFFPVGLNINTLTYECNCDNVPDGTTCEQCYDYGSMDPCCGLMNKLHNNVTPDLLLRDCLPLASYIKFDEARRDLKDNGGNAFKLLWEPKAFDIEFEKINNYYGRQYQAWEMDRVLEDCRDKEIRIQWGMQYQSSFTYRSYGDTRWDWDSGDIFGHQIQNGTDYSWCYKKDLALTSPLQFLNDSMAQTMYKRKLRYMIARWGYSTQIYSMELLSEVNGIGSGHFFICDDSDQDGVCECYTDAFGNPMPHFDELNQVWTTECEGTSSYSIPKPYDTHSHEYRPAVYNWHKTMSEYLKYDLDYGRHLIAAHYVGQAPNQLQDDCGNGDEKAQELGYCQPVTFTDLPAWSSENYDHTWGLNSIDIWSISHYSNTYNRYPDMVFNEFVFYDNTTGRKPVAYAENGSGMGDMDKDITNFILDLYFSSLTGHASAGMSWGHSKRRDQWLWFGRVSSFMQQFFFDAADPQTDNWQPFVNNNYNGEHGKQAIAIGLQRDRNRFIGIIYNRTWNWTTTCPSCTTNLDGSTNEELNTNKLDNSWPPWSQEFQILGAEDVTLNIDVGAVPATYHINYFDPITRTSINQESKLVLDDQMVLPGVPLLTESRPFVLFKMHRTGASFLPSRDGSSAFLDDRTTKKYWVDLPGECSPTPFSQSFFLSSEHELGEIKVIDSFGQLMFSTQTSSNYLEIAGGHWPSGIYFVILGNGKVFKQIKL